MLQHLQQEFKQKAPNLVWASDFTYIKVSGQWYYLCIVMDLFSRKVISWNISAKPDMDWVMHTLHELKLSVFEYIEGFYNSRRPHESLGMMTPNEKEELYWGLA